MTVYVAYLTPDCADWLAKHTFFAANNIEITNMGFGIVAFGAAAMNFLEGLGEDDDGCITHDGAASGETPTNIQIWIETDPYPVIATPYPITSDSDIALDVTALADTIRALPKMPLVARVVTARQLSNAAKTILSGVADEATVELAEEHKYGSGGYAAVAEMLGVTKHTVHKAVREHNKENLNQTPDGRSGQPSPRTRG